MSTLSLSRSVWSTLGCGLLLVLLGSGDCGAPPEGTDAGITACGEHYCFDGLDQACCDGVCAELTRDEKNCGACGTVCDPGRVCLDGVCCTDCLRCGANICGAGQGCCDGQCVNLQGDSAHCGSCGNACPTGAVCDQGQCCQGCTRCGFETCLAGQRCCDGRCVDPQSDEANCGACGQPCREREACIAGQCRCANSQGNDTCTEDEACCGTTSSNNQCIDITSNTGSCGGCGIHCRPHEMCFTGHCVCVENGVIAICSSLDVCCPGLGCRDLDSDPENCGACGAACGAGEICVSGRCTCGSAQGVASPACSGDQACCGSPARCQSAAACSCGSASCGASERCCVDDVGGQQAERCVQTARDVHHCGSCGHGCGNGQVCEAGVCTCRYPLASCNGLASDGCETALTVDPDNCGACGRRCTQGQVCDGAGQCALECQPTFTNCDGRCADLLVDRQHCGACGNACGAGTVCDGTGQCTLSCQRGFTACDGRCVNLELDQRHCGTCGMSCPAGQVCDGTGQCALSCQAGLSACGGVCVDLQTDRRHCGACGQGCASGAICDGHGQCALSCQPGLTDCAGTCVDLLVDRRHCGVCGNGCAAGEVCDGQGQCQLSCQSGLTVCAGACVDLQRDARHCQACGLACAPGEICEGGRCLAACSLPSDAGVVDSAGVGQDASAAQDAAPPADAAALDSATGNDANQGLDAGSTDRTTGPDTGSSDLAPAVDSTAGNDAAAGADAWAEDASVDTRWVRPYSAAYPLLLDYANRGNATPCLDQSSGPDYNACVQVGLWRAVSVAGHATCDELTAEDRAGWLEWRCDGGTNPVRMVGYALRPGRRLADLLDASVPAFRTNEVRVSDSAGELFTTPGEVWWDNPVQLVAQSGLADLAEPGTLYVVDEDRQGPLVISAGHVGLIVLPGKRTAGNAAGDALTVQQAPFAWIEGDFDGAGVAGGVRLDTARFCVLTDVRIENASGFTGGLSLSNADKNILRRVRVANSTFTAGVQLSAADHNLIEDLVVTNGASRGVALAGNSNHNRLLRVVVANNSGRGLSIDSSDDNLVAGAMLANNVGDGLYLYLADNNLLRRVVAANNRDWGVTLDASKHNTLEDVVSGHNGSGGIYDGASTDNFFTGLLHVGPNGPGGTVRCSVPAGSFQHCPGLVHGTCTNTGAEDSSSYTSQPDVASCLAGRSSDAVFSTTRGDLAAGFVGKVDDAVNQSDDGAGQAGYPTDLSAFDWLGFASAWRGWGQSGGAFPDQGATNRGHCSGGATCQIWDWRVPEVGSSLRDVHAPRLDGQVASTLRHTLVDATVVTVLRDADELQGDEVGDDDGLCETDERCLAAIHLGRDVLEPAPTAAGTFVDGDTLQRIELLRW